MEKPFPIVRTPGLSAIVSRVRLAGRGSPIRLLVEGKRGVGKAAAIEQGISEHPCPTDLVVLRGAADNFRTPLSPFAEAFSYLMHKYARRDRLKRVAADLAADLMRLVPFLTPIEGSVREIYDAAVPRTSPDLTNGADLSYRIYKVIRTLARSTHPLLVFFDINRYDSSTLAVLAQLAAREDLDCSFVFTKDPYWVLPETGLPDSRFSGYEVDLLTRLNFAKFTLGPFSHHDTATYLQTALGPRALDEQQINLIHRKTGGNALFLQELLSHLLSDGFFVDQNGEKRLCRDIELGTLPESIRSLITARIDALPSELRDVVNIASVMGVEFYALPISETLHLEHLLVLQRLRRLQVTYDLIEEMEKAHRFSTEAVRDAVYESLGNALAREHHLMLARYFERHPEQNDVDYLLYYHYSRAGVQDSALKFITKAAFSARSTFAYDEAAHRFLVARQLAYSTKAPSDTQTQLALEEALATYDAGSFLLASELLDRLAQELSPSENKAHALLYLGLAQYLLDKPELAIETLAVLEAGTLSYLTDELRLRHLLTKTSVLYALGKWPAARAVYLQCIKEIVSLTPFLAADVLKRVNIFYLPEFAGPMLQKAKKGIEGAGTSPLLWEIHHNIGGNYFLTGDLGSAEEHFLAAIREFELLGTYRISYPLNNLGLIKLLRGEYAAARDLFLQVKAIATLDFDLMSAKCHLAILNCLEGKPELAVLELEKLCAKAATMSEMILVDLIYHNLAWAYMLMEESEKALRILHSSPGVAKDLWSSFRVARRDRMLRALSSDSIITISEGPKLPDILHTTGRQDSWTFKNLPYELNDLWFWE